VHIVVCIKQVPDAPSIRMDRQRMTVIREDVESIINPLDAVALSTAMDLRSGQGGRVSVLTMGPPQSEASLREAIAAGADQAILLSDPRFAGADTLATSHVLAAAISRLVPFPDLVICGMQTIDSDTGHVGPQIAEELDFVHVCGVSEIYLEGRSMTVKRLSDGFLDSLRLSLPALLTVSEGLSEVRDIPLGALESAFTKEEIVRWGMEELGLKEEEVGLAGSATEIWRLKPAPAKKGGDRLSGPPDMLAQHLIHKLEALSILDEEDDIE